MSSKQTLVRDAALYTAMSILTQLITLAAGILTRKFLGPVQMGMWSVLQIILVYAAYSSLGVSEATSREIPYYYGKGEGKKADEIKNHICTFSMFTTGLISAGVLIYALVMRSRLPAEMFTGLIFLPVLLILQRFSNLKISLLRAYKQFDLAGRQMFWSALFNGAAVAVLSYKFQLFGFMWAMLASFVFNILFIDFHYRISFLWRLDFRKIWDLILYGFPLMIVGFMGSFFLSIDKMMIAKMLGFEALGVYSIAILAYTYLGSIPNAIGIVLIPNFHQKFSESDNPESLRGYLTKSSAAFSDIMPLIIGGGWFFIPYFTRLILPDYAGSIEPMRVLILSAFFLALLHPYSYFLAVIRKQLLLLPIVGGACLLAFAANYFVISSGHGLIGVSAATGAVIFIKFSATYFLSAKAVFSTRERLKYYVFYLGKFCYMLLVLWGLTKWSLSEASLAGVMGKTAVFVLAYIPLLYQLNRELNLLSLLRNKSKSRVTPEEEVSGV